MKQSEFLRKCFVYIFYCKCKVVNVTNYPTELNGLVYSEIVAFYDPCVYASNVSTFFSSFIIFYYLSFSLLSLFNVLTFSSLYDSGRYLKSMYFLNTLPSYDELLFS